MILEGLIFVSISWVQRMAQADAAFLGSPEVRRELRLAPGVEERVKELMVDAQLLSRGGVFSRREFEAFQERRRKSPPESLRQRAWALLTPSQGRRLDQIRLQSIAPYVLNDPVLAARLGASPSQVARVREAQARENVEYGIRSKPLMEAWTRVNAGLAQGDGADFDARWKALAAEETKRCRLALDKELTARQRRRLRGMLGKPFLVKMTSDLPIVPRD